MSSSLVAVAAVGVVVGCYVAAAVVVPRSSSLHVSSFSVAVAFSVSVSCLSSSSYSVPAIPCSLFALSCLSPVCLSPSPVPCLEPK